MHSGTTTRATVTPSRRRSLRSPSDGNVVVLPHLVCHTYRLSKLPAPRQHSFRNAYSTFACVFIKYYFTNKHLQPILHGATRKLVICFWSVVYQNKVSNKRALTTIISFDWVLHWYICWMHMFVNKYCAHSPTAKWAYIFYLISKSLKNGCKGTLKDNS